jgi:hypothetical protein
MLLRRRPARSKAPTALPAAALIGLAGIALSRTVRPERRVELASVELAFIAGSYPAMALSAEDSRVRATELMAGVGFAGCAFAGLTFRSPRLLAGGLLAHGAWDFAHHFGRPGSDVPSWYPLFCLLADLMLAQPLLGKRGAAPTPRVNGGLHG